MSEKLVKSAESMWKNYPVPEQQVPDLAEQLKSNEALQEQNEENHKFVSHLLFDICCMMCLIFVKHVNID